MLAEFRAQIMAVKSVLSELVKTDGAIETVRPAFDAAIMFGGVEAAPVRHGSGLRPG